MKPEIETLKSRLRSTWMDGDFGVIAKSYLPGAEEFVGRLGIKPGVAVLDVACGTGNSAIPAARLGAAVTGTDIATNLLEQARRNAEAEGLTIRFEEGDAEALPYPNASFDHVITMFGAMFAPRPEMVAAELLRVCRPDGSIAMANWTPAGFVGQLFKTVGAHVTPPAAMPSPILWGDDATVRERFGDGAAEIRITARMITFSYPFSPAEVVEEFRRYYGPTKKAFDSLDEAGQAALRMDLNELWTSANRATDGTTEYESEYLEVIVVPR